ncbi:MAG TPA: CBS domain-containing protein [Minicystis sp.]|nr:CBS domain-containing protein [Minicystis sp.]
MRVGEICSRSVSDVLPDVSILEASRRMREEHVGDLVVVEQRGGRRVPIGVLTDRDIVVGILAKDGAHAHTLNVGDVLTGTLVTATEDEDLDAVLARMRRFGVRRVPVLDEHGGLGGILAVDDVLVALADEFREVASLVARQSERERERRP